jgi:leucyl aminopeptidase (aminopeptidase T)
VYISEADKGRMSADPTVPAAMASMLLGGALTVRPKENVIIESWSHMMPYATACVLEARRRGARPLLLMEDEGTFWQSPEPTGATSAWSRAGAHEWAALARTQAYVFFPGPADRPRLNGLSAETRQALFASNAEWYARARRARVRGVRSVLGYASDPQAAFLHVNAATWRSQLVKGALGADLLQIAKDARRIAALLRRGRELRITGSNGSDVRARLKHRQPVVDDGRVDIEDLGHGWNMTNSPPGKVVVALDEKSAEGVLVANRPSFLRSGRVDQGQWEFQAGRLGNAWFAEGKESFDTAYAAAPSGKDVVGLFSIGLNPALAPGVPRVEDHEAGSITIGIGGNAEFGGSSRCPYVSWIVLGEATVAVDGIPVVDRGHLL